MLQKVKDKMPRERLVPLHKRDTRPFGVFDVNEGSKKGIIELLEKICKRARMEVGDWLSSNNFWHAQEIGEMIHRQWTV
jgi:hypothetical protein